MKKTNLIIAIFLILLLLIIINSKDHFKNTIEKMVGDTIVQYRGDVNDDKKINSSDYILVKKYILGKTTLDDSQKKRADTNSDGSINSADYIKIKKIILNNTPAEVIETPTPTTSKQCFYNKSNWRYCWGTDTSCGNGYELYTPITKESECINACYCCTDPYNCSYNNCGIYALWDWNANGYPGWNPLYKNGTHVTSENECKVDSPTSISIKDFGAKCDGKSDDTEALIAAFGYANNHEISQIDLGNGKCNVSRTINLYCNTTSSNANVRRKMTIKGSATFNHSNISLIAIHSGCDVVNLEDFTSVSNYDPKKRDINNDGTVDGYDSITHIAVASDNTNIKLTLSNITLTGGVNGVSFSGLNNLTVKNSTFKNMNFVPEAGRGGYGILCQGCSNVNISNSNFIAGPFYRHAIYVSLSSSYPNSSNWTIDNCNFDYTGITSVNLKEYNYPTGRYPTSEKNNIWSPDTSPIMVRTVKNITVSNNTFKGTPSIGVYAAEEGHSTGVYLKNNTITPTIRNGEYNYGAMFRGYDKDRTVTGIVDGLTVNNPPNNYNYIGAVYSTVEVKNANTTLSVKNISGTSTITGFKGKIIK